MPATEPGATGGEDPVKLSDEDKKLLAAFKGLHFKPTSIESTDDLVSFMKKYGTVTKSKPEPTVKTEPAGAGGGGDPVVADPGLRASYHFPKLSNFSGEGTKADVSWETFKFEIEALLRERLFSEEQILQGVRRAAKGDVGDILRRLGPDARINDIIEKLDSTYGNIETKESILRKFYSCTQQKGQTVTTFASQIEEVFTQAVNLGALRRSDTDSLKQVLHQGLNRDLKHMSAYKCDTVTDYDKFKIELRKLESEMKEESTPKTCKAAVVNEGQNSEMMQLLRKINDRIDVLEKHDSERADTQRTQQFAPLSTLHLDLSVVEIPEGCTGVSREVVIRPFVLLMGPHFSRLVMVVGKRGTWLKIVLRRTVRLNQLVLDVNSRDIF